MKTIRESLQAVNDGYSIVVYPEDSEKGYLEQLEDFYLGFAVFAEAALKKGVDLPVVVSYFKKKENVYIFDKGVRYSVLKAEHGDKEKVAKALLDRCNELGRMNASELVEEENAKQNNL